MEANIVVLNFEIGQSTIAKDAVNEDNDDERDGLQEKEEVHDGLFFPSNHHTTFNEEDHYSILQTDSPSNFQAYRQTT